MREARPAEDRGGRIPAAPPSPAVPRVVVVGGGFGGLALVRRLRGAKCAITLLDRRNFHLFQPLLYQVATAGLSPANIASPLRRILRRRRDVTVLLAEVSGFDLAARRVLFADGGHAEYEFLVVAAGSRTHYFAHPEWRARAPGLKTVEDAVDIRRRVFLAFEQAERAEDAAAIREHLTFVVVGGGPTGVELAGALAEIAQGTLRRDFRRIDPAAARVLLVEASSRVLATYPEDLARRATESLWRLGVVVRTDALVVEIGEREVVLQCDQRRESVASRTVIWAAGVRGSPLGPALARAAGVETDRMERVPVGPRLSIAGRDDVFVIGDLARSDGPHGEPLPGIAPVAIQGGRYVAGLIRAKLRGEPLPPPFRYRHAGDMATVGRRSAVAAVGGVHASGRVAWIAWLALHLIWLMEFENRVLVFIQWTWSYVTYHRAARIITGDDDGA